MRSWNRISPEEFIGAVSPLLQRKDAAALKLLLHRRWSSDQIVSLLQCPNHDARKMAALALSLVGCRGCMAPLATLLHDADPMINQLAEHALWSIWFHLGSEDANHELHRGVQAMGRQEYAHAVQHFTRAIQLQPDFAEAYNQRATARYLQEDFEGSIRDSLKAVELLPQHFGAWAGLGHAYACGGQFRSAVAAYEKALQINPHLACLREAIDELRPAVNAE